MGDVCAGIVLSGTEADKHAACEAVGADNAYPAQVCIYDLYLQTCVPMVSLNPNDDLHHTSELTLAELDLLHPIPDEADKARANTAAMGKLILAEGGVLAVCYKLDSAFNRNDVCSTRQSYETCSGAVPTSEPEQRFEEFS